MIFLFDHVKLSLAAAGPSTVSQAWQGVFKGTADTSIVSHLH